MDNPFALNTTDVPQGDPAGQAVASLKGYAYQIYASALAWLDLREGEEIYLEVAQDYATAVNNALTAVQVKDTRAKITINSPTVRQAINDFVDLVKRNPRRQVTLRFLTTSSIGTEKSIKYRAAGEPTLVYWCKARTDADIKPLRKVLERLDLAVAAKAYIQERTDEQLRNDLVKRIVWDCGAQDFSTLKKELEDEVVVFANQRLKVPPSEGRRATASILLHVLQQTLEAKPPNRKLTPASLLDLMERATNLSIPRGGLETHVRAVISEAVHSIDKTSVNIASAPQFDIARDALERDFLLRYCQAERRSLFPEVQKQDHFQPLARQILDAKLVVLSEEVRRRILLRATRYAALKKDLPAAETYMAAAAALKGPDTDLPALARLAEARGETETAIQILRDAADPDSRATLLSIIERDRGTDAALAWWMDENMSVHDLTPNGVITLCNLHLKKEEYLLVKDILEVLNEKQTDNCPYLLLFRSIIRFTSILAKSERHLALMGMQLDIRRARPITPDAETTATLNGALQDARRLVPVLKELCLQETIKIVEEYVYWFELLHPEHRNTALVRLASDMENPITAPKRIHFALAYLPDFDPVPILKHLEKRAAFGGLNEDELRACLCIHMDNHESTAPLAAFIALHREKLDAAFGKLSIRQIEIEALARAGDGSGARTILDANRDAIDLEDMVRLNAAISTAEGADPVTEFKRAYDEAKSIEALRNLIGFLSERNDHRSVAPYSEELYEKSGDPIHLAFAARSYALAGDNDSFMRISEANKSILEHDSSLRRHYAWQLFSRGRLKEAVAQTNKLAEAGATRELDLEIAISIETGEWEALSQPLAAYLQSAPNVPAITLIRAAHLSQAAGQGPLKELVQAAVAKGSNDPNVLLGAYTVYVEEGLEDIKEEVHQWFSRALDLSGPDGPVRQFELKEILEKQTEWNEHTRRIQDGIMRGDIPLIVAITGLRTTLVDLYLRNFTRNIGLSDSRRKVTLPLFSGRRSPELLGKINRLALDFTALLVLGWLGLLPKVLETFNKIVLPSGTFRDLFEGRRRIREFQKSRLRHAEQVQQAIASERIKIVRASLTRLDPMVAEVGDELAGLLRIAESTNGIVLRPAPIHKPGLLNEDADVSPHMHRLADTHSLLKVLQDAGVTDQPTEEAASRYFALQDKGWPGAVCPDPNRPLYIEGLGLLYIYSVGLLDAVLTAFPQVFIHSSTADEALALIEHDKRTSEVLQIIDDIRDAVRKAQSDDKIVYGPHASRNWSEDDNDGGIKAFDSSTLNLVANLMDAEVAVIDDRGINKEPFILDNHGHRARVVTSLDIIEELCKRKVINDDQRRVLRHKLRCAGASLVPLDKEEIVVAALRRRGSSDSAEFRMMKESILLARVANIPRFPSEIPWFASAALTVKNAIMEMWVREPDKQRAATLADAIRGLQIDPEDWINQWDDQVPPDWPKAVNLVLVAALAVPFELQDEELRQAYNRWAESNVLDPLRLGNPKTYDAVVDHIRLLINSVAKETITDKNIAIPKEFRVNWALRQLSDKLRSDILKDPAIPTQWGISTTRTVRLTSSLTAQWKSLCSLFRAAADGTTIPALLDEKGKKHAVKVSIDPDGAGILQIGKHRLRFPQAMLMVTSPETRLRELEKSFHAATIHANLQDKLRLIIGRSDFGVEEFISVVGALSSSPNEFQVRLSEKLATRHVSMGDILPDDDRHWDNLTAPVATSSTLAEFITDELASEWASRVARDPVFAFRSIALAFSAPSLVPSNLFQKLDQETKKVILENSLLLEDHFSLIGAFELCAESIVDNPGFCDVGERLLDCLFSDIKRLETACGMFAAAFVLSVAKIAEDENLNSRPAFWRRLAAASHALLVVRSCGVTEIDYEALIKSAVDHSGQAYHLSVFSDFKTDPQWRPEWIDPRLLVADTCGRGIGAYVKIPKDKAPPSWTERIEKLETWIREKKYEVFMLFPAVLEGARRPTLPSVSEMQQMGVLYEELMRNPSVSNLLKVMAPIHMFGPPREITESLYAVLKIIHSDSSTDEEGTLANSIRILSHLAALFQDVGLANAVAEVCIERLVVDERPETVLETFYRLVECSAAETDKAAAAHFLARMLEHVCHTLSKSDLLLSVAAMIEELKCVSPELRCALGRALSIAKLGASRPVAA